jgi:DNA-binding FadR family transcriptional regulator
MAHEIAMLSADNSPVRRVKLSEQIYDLIYQRIATGQYAEGGRLSSESEFAQEFQASRPTVREALIALREDGVISSRHRVGYFVLGTGDQNHLRFLPLGSLADVQRCFLFRISLEGEAAFYAACNRTDEDIASIEKAASELSDLVDAKKPSVDADYAFHLAVIEASHNRFFGSTIRSLINHVRTGMSLCRRLSLEQPELHLDQMKEEHQRVVDAVIAKDGTAARQAIRYHLDASRQRVFLGQHLL